MNALISVYQYCTWVYHYCTSGLGSKREPGYQTKSTVNDIYYICQCHFVYLQWVHVVFTIITYQILMDPKSTLTAHENRDWGQGNSIFTLTHWLYHNESSDIRQSVLYIWSGGQWNSIYLVLMLLSDWELRYQTVSTVQGVGVQEMLYTQCWYLKLFHTY